jgi:hypothetical protein
MTIEQLYLAIGIPVITNLLFNGFLFMVVFNRLDKIESKIEVLTGKVTRVSRIEDKLG